jgi:type IV pilus assembly protein PilC
MSNLIEPIMIVVLGGLIGIILVAILLPIYSLGGVILGT